MHEYQRRIDAAKDLGLFTDTVVGVCDACTAGETEPGRRRFMFH